MNNTCGQEMGHAQVASPQCINISTGDTTNANTTINEDTKQCHQYDHDHVSKQIHITITTFGTEVGKRPNKDELNHEIFRCHWIPNPSSKSRKGSTGESKKLRDEILSSTDVIAFVSQCKETIENIVLKGEDESHNQIDGNLQAFHFAFSCARGKHRSVSVAIAVGELLGMHQNISVVFQHFGLLQSGGNKKSRNKGSWKKERNRA